MVKISMFVKGIVEEDGHRIDQSRYKVILVSDGADPFEWELCGIPRGQARSLYVGDRVDMTLKPEG